MTQAAKNLALFAPQTGAMPAYMAQHTDDQGAGNEAVTSNDMAMPVLDVLQALSPQLETIDGAKQGQLCNSITNELYNEVNVINLNFIKDYAVFRKRAKGGGFHGTFPTMEEAKAKAAELGGNIDDYDVIETGKHVVLVLDSDGVPTQPMLIRLKSTALAVSRKWNAEINVVGNGAARFATVWKLQTLKKTNDKGSWYVLDPKFLGWASEDLYASARTFYEATKSAE